MQRSYLCRRQQWLYGCIDFLVQLGAGRCREGEVPWSRLWYGGRIVQSLTTGVSDKVESGFRELH